MVSGCTVLGIETSCDETAVAVLNGHRKVLSHEVLSQREHSLFGGVVPEIAARAHCDFLHILVSRAMDSAGLGFSDLSAIAVTSGPGLVGSLIVGVMLAKAISYVAGKPIIAVNHLEAHALVARMVRDDLEFPFLVLIISGGHCQFLIAHDVGKYTKLGESIDDSLGETFDKVARMLGLGYPGGPEVESCALKGDAHRFPFPRALKGRPGCDFSFSGLKTAVRYTIAKEGSRLDDQALCDVCASFQQCVSEILVSRVANALAASKALDNSISKIVISGGVAANNFLRSSIHKCANELGFDAIFPPKELCTDNGIMVGWAGIENLRKGNLSSLELVPRARWPLCP
ncbi:putative endopeptidase [Anaplasma centrale str. Israel]|uniref:tRNA N6-adenosine threonylcarbamoyltransferase n=1 Tax=Anaplasma centrale (strain Israel) TaxID=574556 RepID=D1AUS6_ANACI|nr:tRNA (adenosine(37)-N6)-threonylcarbamoyltransferase complex transferase subunit TsaD [Anaplasma centrale]ACZ49304.1 putative endopeptidase [Anaplasma centrale str. Israel]